MPPVPIQRRELVSSGAHIGAIVGIVISALVIGVVLGWLVLPRVKAFYHSRQSSRPLVLWFKHKDGQVGSRDRSFFDKDTFAIVTPPPKKDPSVMDLGLPTSYHVDEKRPLSTDSGKLSSEAESFTSLILPKKPSPTITKAQSLGVPPLMIPGVPEPPSLRQTVIRPAEPDSPGSLYSQMSAATYLHQLVEVAAAPPPPLPTKSIRSSSMTLGEFLRTRRAREEKDRMDQQYLQIIAASVGHPKPKGPRPVSRRSTKRKSRPVEPMATVNEDGKLDNHSSLEWDSEGESIDSSSSFNSTPRLCLESPTIPVKHDPMVIVPVVPLNLVKAQPRTSL